MNELFENRYTLTRERLTEFAAATFSKGHQGFSLVYGVLLLVVAGMQLSLVSKGKGSPFLFIVALACALLCFWMFFDRGRSTAKKVYQRQMKASGGKEAAISVSFGDEITMKNMETGGEQKIPFQEVQKVIESPNMVVLMLPKRQGIMVAKEGFVKGTAEEFDRFLQQKCPEAYAKKKSLPI
ncbi:YcxB family protein [Acidaminobacterium chupaoyuni]